VFDTRHSRPPSPRTDAEPRSRAHPFVLGALAAALTLVELWPYTGVVMPGLWGYVTVVLVVVVAVSGMLTRIALRRAARGIRQPLALLVQLAAAAIACTLLLAGETAAYGLLPTETTVRLIGARIEQSVTEIMTGVAPVPASLPLATVLGLAFAVVAILIDQLVALRLVILTIVLASVVGVMPMLISFGAINIAWFLMHALVVLLVLRHAARHDRRAPRESSYLAAGAVGAAATAVALVVAPGLPVIATLPGTGPALTVNADLNLGQDLRRPQNVEVMTLVTSGAQPPYLRIASLSSFNGVVWRPDRGPRQPLEAGFGERDWGDDIETVEQEVSIRVTGVSSARLPVPYAAERISGAGDSWQAVPVNRTVISRSEDAIGEDYTVATATAVPTLEQIRASDARGGGEDAALGAESLPAVISETAREVTAGATNDYDRLIALQDWFRSEFSYSLETPVEEGFDGTGADAVETFLEQRTGYCIHFAGAFALMAQTLDMPVRIIVGYLPGVATDERRGDDRIYSITSDQLHAWPEVHFRGIGWVPFEPTATLGVPTAFTAASGAGGSGETPTAPTPSATPSASSSADPRGLDDPGASQPGGGSVLRTLDPTPVTFTMLGILVALLLPASVRMLQRAVRLSRARAGDAMAAWRELSATMIDLGLPTPAAQTARMRADELVRKRSAPASALSTLVDAVELTSYAPAGSGRGDLAAPLLQVRSQLLAGVDGRRRFAARMLPVSLVRRG